MHGRVKSRAAAETPSHDVRFSAVDVETTGLDPLGNRIIEIAVVRLDASGKETDVWSSLVNPQCEVSAVEIHGIRGRDVRRAPVFPAIAETVAELLENTVFVAHNARFDRSFLNAEFARAGTDYRIRPENTVCTMDQSKIYCEPGPHSLSGLCSRLGFGQTGAHRALNDARMCAKLLRYYLRHEELNLRCCERALSRQGTEIFPESWTRAVPWKMRPAR